MAFYAVARGHKTGIFTVWAEVKEAIDGFKNPLFRKFMSKEKAEAFMQNPVENIFSKGEASNAKADYYVYTDGSCINNGKSNAKAGLGVYFGEDDPRNISEKLPKGEKQTNNTAELSAIIRAYDVIKKDIEAGKNICIMTDSSYAMKCVGGYGARMEKEGWKKDIANKELVKTIYSLYKDHKNVKFKHIDAHTGKQDEHSLGNEGADRLANKALGLEGCPYAAGKHAKAELIILNVPFKQKNEAKELGAKWNPKKKKWTTDTSNPNHKKLVETFG